MAAGRFDHLQIEEVLHTPWLYETDDVVWCSGIISLFDSGLLSDTELTQILYSYYHHKYPDTLGDIYYFRFCLDYMQPDFFCKEYSRYEP